MIRRRIRGSIGFVVEFVIGVLLGRRGVFFMLNLLCIGWFR